MGKEVLHRGGGGHSEDLRGFDRGRCTGRSMEGCLLLLILNVVEDVVEKGDDIGDLESVGGTHMSG